MMRRCFEPIIVWVASITLMIVFDTVAENLYGIEPNTKTDRPIMALASVVVYVAAVMRPHPQRTGATMPTKAELQQRLDEMTAYADKLAAGLPCMPKDEEELRRANAEPTAQAEIFGPVIQRLKEKIGSQEVKIAHLEHQIAVLEKSSGKSTLGDTDAT